MTRYWIFGRFLRKRMEITCEWPLIFIKNKKVLKKRFQFSYKIMETANHFLEYLDLEAEIFTVCSYNIKFKIFLCFIDQVFIYNFSLIDFFFGGLAYCMLKLNHILYFLLARYMCFKIKNMSKKYKIWFILNSQSKFQPPYPSIIASYCGFRIRNFRDFIWKSKKL